MATKTEPDAEVLDALDFEPRCEIMRRGDREHPATWAVSLTCAHSVMLCDLIADYATKSGPLGWVCPTCGATVDIVALTPLGHRS